MIIKTGYLYHIKDEFFDVVNDKNLMSNHERGKMRPAYFNIKDGDILWFIPLSSKVDKYEKIIENKIKKYGCCDSIIIEEIFKIKHAILLQNAFPILPKYISHVHTINKIPTKVPDVLQKEISLKFNNLLNMKKHGINLFFADVDKIKEQLEDEIKVYN